MWLYAVGSLLMGLTLGLIAIELDRARRSASVRRKTEHQVFSGPWG